MKTHEFVDDDSDEDEACRVCGAPAEDHETVVHKHRTQPYIEAKELADYAPDLLQSLNADLIAEIEGYQALVGAAREVISRWEGARWTGGAMHRLRQALQAIESR